MPPEVYLFVAAAGQCSGGRYPGEADLKLITVNNETNGKFLHSSCGAFIYNLI